MSVVLDVTGVVSRLINAENVLLLCHKNPDGDTLGSAGALQWALKSLKKNVAVLCSDNISPMYGFMNLELFTEQFRPEYIVAVDVASIQLFGDKIMKYSDRIDLCIDHHGSNTGYAEYLLLDDSAAANCELIYAVIIAMGVTVDSQIADCLYSGVATDTGCFRFTNTTANTHRVAARLFELGASVPMLNELFFENKSKERIALEQVALSSLQYYFDGKCAMICLTWEQIEETGVADSELDGITSMPRAIEGVLVGVTMRQQPGGSYKISVRTKNGLDACKVCTALGGGGHKQAAGCEIMGSLENAKKAILLEVEKVMRENGLVVPLEKAAKE